MHAPTTSTFFPLYSSADLWLYECKAFPPKVSYRHRISTENSASTPRHTHQALVFGDLAPPLAEANGENDVLDVEGALLAVRASPRDNGPGACLFVVRGADDGRASEDIEVEGGRVGLEPVAELMESISPSCSIAEKREKVRVESGTV